jgi:hypothetical protein
METFASQVVAGIADPGFRYGLRYSDASSGTAANYVLAARLSLQSVSLVTVPNLPRVVGSVDRSGADRTLGRAGAAQE